MLLQGKNYNTNALAESIFAYQGFVEPQKHDSYLNFRKPLRSV